MKPLDVDVICNREDLPFFNPYQSTKISTKYFNVCNRGHLLRTTRAVDINFRELASEKTDRAIIFIGPDQHWGEFTDLFKKVVDNYKYKVMITDEPIWSKLKWNPNKPTKAHQHSLDLLQPDVVGYSCLVDCRLCPVKSFYWTGFVDKYVTEEDPLSPCAVDSVAQSPFKVRRVISAGRYHRKFRSWSEIENLCEGSKLLHEMVHFGAMSYQDLTDRVQGSLFQFQPRCGFHFHPLRSLQSWFSGTIPLIFADDLECEELLEHCEKLSLKNFENCIIFNEDNIHEAIAACRDVGCCNTMLNNIKEMDLTNYTTEKVCENIYKSILEID